MNISLTAGTSWSSLMHNLQVSAAGSGSSRLSRILLIIRSYVARILSSMHKASLLKASVVFSRAALNEALADAKLS